MRFKPSAWLRPFDDRPGDVGAKVGITCVVLLVANAAAWLWALAVFADRPVLLGTALLAYTFGLRHAVDADHIAAIDNVVRKLMADGKRPFSAGFFFSLGHSTIVLLASLGIAVTAAALKGRLDRIHEVGGIIGTAVSAAFLLTIGVANLVVLRSIWSAFDRARRGERVTDEDLDALLAGRGLLSRVLRPVFRLVSRSWHMYPVGVLFGLGFDTATEIGLLGISATQAAAGLSFWTILVFPALFTAAMSLVDTVDSILTTGAYGWAFTRPVRKLWYNLTMTAASVAVALFIGGIEALGLIGDKLGLSGSFWSAIMSLNDNLTHFALAVVVIFLGSWAVSTVVYRVRGYGAMEA